LEIDDDGLLLASMLLRRELRLEREEFVVVCREADGEDCVLGVVIDCLCVVIEPPMRDDMEELILPFEFAVDRLLTFDLEFVVVEFLPKMLPMLSPLFEVLWSCLELVEGVVIELDRSELEFDCVLGVVMEGRCVVIELPMRDDIEELILPFEFVVDRLLTFDREFVVAELLPKRLPILIDPVDLFVDDELDGSLPTLALPDGLDGTLRFVVILLELFLDVIALELRLGTVTLERFVVGVRLVMLLDEVLRLGNETLGLEELTDRELLLTLLRLLLVFVRAGADLAAEALWDELLDLAFFLAGKAGSARKISAQASIISAIAGFLRFFRANMICLLSSTKPQKRPRSFTTLHKKGTTELHYST